MFDLNCRTTSSRTSQQKNLRATQHKNNNHNKHGLNFPIIMWVKMLVITFIIKGVKNELENKLNLYSYNGKQTILQICFFFVFSYYGAASAGASPTLFYSMPPPGLTALGGGTLGPQNMSAGFTSALAAAAAAAGAGATPVSMASGPTGGLMASHHALSAGHPLTQSHLVRFYWDKEGKAR